MLAKRYRFSFKNKLPKHVLNSPSFNVRYEKNDLGRLAAAVVVSKKVDKRATIRNKIKRKIVEEVSQKLDLNRPVSLVFYVKKQAASSETLESEIDTILSRIR